MIRQRYERDLPDRDPHLVVGNLAKRQQTFVTIVALIAIAFPILPDASGQAREP